MYRLSDTEISFPHPDCADEDGYLAYGGDLSIERLFFAYQWGIFPWYSEQPIRWWSPDPRFVLFPDRIKVSSSMKKILKKGIFNITFNQEFSTVMKKCRDQRIDAEGSWIGDEMIDAYTELHRLGFAHSAEAWQDGQLVGGLYGVRLGNVFFGESMFHTVTNASKAAFITMVENLRSTGCVIIDCQVKTDHLESLGAEFIHRKDFLNILEHEVRAKL